MIVGYWEGSDEAFAASVYIRWKLGDGSVSVSLLASRARVTPLVRISTLRSELNGAVILTRLLKSLLQALDIKVNRTWILGDSTCVLASREKQHGSYGEFWGNRIGEILDSQDVIEEYGPVGHQNGDWYHVASHDNAADLPSRPNATPADVGPGSRWQLGPAYLLLPPDEWPVNRTFAEAKEEHIPQQEVINM